MTIELTESEIKSLNFVIEKGLIDLKGFKAIGMGGDNTIRDLNRVKRKFRLGGIT